MNRVYACYGRYASTPYTIKKTHIHVFCVEELCFYIRENAYFIDDDFFDQDMFLWLEEECGLSSIAKKLRNKYRTDKSSESLVRILFEETFYADMEQLNQTLAILKNNQKMSQQEKLKLQGDFFLKNEKYTLALDCYEDLVKLMTGRKDKKLLAAAYHNLGVIYARLFMFESAGEYFRKAYDTSGDKSYMVDYLASIRCAYSDDKYLKKLNIIDGAYDYSSALEEKVDAINKAYENSDEYTAVKNIIKLKNDKAADYKEKADSFVEGIKEEYRESMEK